MPLSAFDSLMEERKSNVNRSMGSVTGMRKNLQRRWEHTLSQSIKVLLNRNPSVKSGGKALSIVSKLFARAILDYIVGKENVSIGDVMIECLCCPLLIGDAKTTKTLKRILQD